MKKLLTLLSVALVACTLAIPSDSANAGGLWDMVKNAGSEGSIETRQYTIEVAGVDIRGYVYEVPEMKSICWQVFTERHQTLVCKTYKEIGLEE